MTAADLTALVRELAENPGDTSLRRIYADALEDVGDVHEARRQREEARLLPLLAERRVYYARHPRDFANEYDVFVVPRSMASRLEAVYPDASRISRREAVRMGISRPAEAKRDGEQWYGGLLGDDMATTPAAQLDACCRASIEAIEEAEMLAEAADEMRRQDDEAADETSGW